MASPRQSHQPAGALTAAGVSRSPGQAALAKPGATATAPPTLEPQASARSSMFAASLSSAATAPGGVPDQQALARISIAMQQVEQQRDMLRQQRQLLESLQQQQQQQQQQHHHPAAGAAAASTGSGLSGQSLDVMAMAQALGAAMAASGGGTSSCTSHSVNDYAAPAADQQLLALLLRARGRLQPQPSGVPSPVGSPRAVPALLHADAGSFTGASAGDAAAAIAAVVAAAAMGPPGAAAATPGPGADERAAPPVPAPKEAAAASGGCSAVDALNASHAGVPPAVAAAATAALAATADVPCGTKLVQQMLLHQATPKRSLSFSSGRHELSMLGQAAPAASAPAAVPTAGAAAPEAPLLHRRLHMLVSAALEDRHACCSDDSGAVAAAMPADSTGCGMPDAGCGLLPRSISGISAIASLAAAGQVGGAGGSASRLGDDTAQQQQQPYQQGDAPVCAVGTAAYAALLESLLAGMASQRKQAAAIVRQAAAAGILPARCTERLLQHQQQHKPAADTHATAAHNGVKRARDQEEPLPDADAAAAGAGADGTASAAVEEPALKVRRLASGQGSTAAAEAAAAEAAAPDVDMAGPAAETPAPAAAAAVAAAGTDDTKLAADVSTPHTSEPASGDSKQPPSSSAAATTTSLALQAVSVMCQSQMMGKRLAQMLLDAHNNTAAALAAPASAHTAEQQQAASTTTALVIMQTRLQQAAMQNQDLRGRLLLAEVQRGASHDNLVRMQREHDALSAAHVQLLSRVTRGVDQLVGLARASSHLGLEERQALTAVARALLTGV